VPFIFSSGGLTAGCFNIVVLLLLLPVDFFNFGDDFGYSSATLGFRL
jgi:hypothetical protein